MIFNENLDNTNLESLLAGIKNYSVMTDQIADNLHDLQRVAQHNPEIAFLMHFWNNHVIINPKERYKQCRKKATQLLP